MKPGNPWSVKGIQPAARQAAKEAARRHGMTLGQWLNHVIMDSNQEQTDVATKKQPAGGKKAGERTASVQQTAASAPKSQHLHDKIEDLAARLDSIVNKQSGQVDLDQWETDKRRSSDWGDIAVRNVIREEASVTEPLPVIAHGQSPEPKSEPHPESKTEVFGERISALTEKLDSVVQARAATHSRSDQNMKELEAALRNVISHIEASDRQNTDVMKTIQARLSELSSRSTNSNDSALQQLTSTVSQMDDRLSYLSQRVVKTETEFREFMKLEEKIQALSSRLDSSLDRESDPQILALENQINQLGSQLDELIRASGNTEAADRFEARLDEITGRIENSEQQQHKFSSLEESISQLFEAVEQNRNTVQENIFKANQKSIETMETIAEQAARKAAENAAQRSAEHVAAIMADDGLNKKEMTASIAKLRNEMHTLQETTIQAVRRSAEETITAGLNGQAAKAMAEPMMELRQQFDQLQESTKSAELRNQDTLEAVHDTLEKVVERLVTLESSPPQQLERPPLPSLSVPEIESDSSDGFKQVFHISDDRENETENGDEPAQPFAGDDQLTADRDPDREPEFRLQRQSRTISSETPFSSQHDRRIDPTFELHDSKDTQREKENSNGPGPGLNHNYLEAARRAAQAASLMPRNRTDFDRDEMKATDGASESGNKLLAMATQSEKKRKSLLLVAAAVLLVIGALSAASLMTDKPANIISSSATGTGAVIPANKPAGIDAKSNKTPADAQTPAAPEIAKQAISPVSKIPSRTRTDAIQLSKDLQAAPDITASISKPVETSKLNRIQSPRINSAAASKSPPSAISLNDYSRTAQTERPANPVKVARLNVTGSDQPASMNDISHTGPLPPEAIGPLGLRRAAAAGDATAQFEIAARYTAGKLVPQDFSKAISWYQKAAAQGLAPAQYRLGTFYEKGRGVAKDKTAARMWYERAAAKGNLKATHNLAVIYADGSKGKPDFAKAGLWFRKAAELGLADSQYNLAILHDRGLGVSKDLTKAYFWFQIAGNQGDKDAAARAAIIEKRLTPDQLARTKLLISNWRPLTLNKSANEVTLPFDGWQSASSIQARLPGTEKTSFTHKDLVILAQGYLSRLGYDAGPDDGILGTQTRDAIKEFQRQNQLPVSGDVSPGLVRKLKAAAG